MTNSETPLKLRLAKLIAEEKPFAWAKRVGINGATFNRVWNEGGQLKSDHLELIYRKTGVCLDWLVAGTGPMYEKDRPQPEPPEGSLPGDFVVVPMMQGKISAGGGLVPDTTIEMTVAFRREWLGRKGDHHTMSVIRVQGDSMAPTLLPGDVVLINHGITTVAASGGIYAITLRDEILIKRVTVEYPGERLVIISDNSRYAQSYADPGQVIINGKVVWYGRDLER